MKIYIKYKRDKTPEVSSEDVKERKSGTPPLTSTVSSVSSASTVSTASTLSPAAASATTPTEGLGKESAEYFEMAQLPVFDKQWIIADILMKTKAPHEIKIVNPPNKDMVLAGAEEQLKNLPQIVTELLKGSNGKALPTLEAVNILRGGLKLIPDEVVSIEKKTEFVNNHFKHLSKFCRDVAYSEPITPLETQTVPIKITKTPFKITFAQYEKALMNIDDSNFIVLTIGLLEGFDTEKKHQHELEAIKQDYLELNYDRAKKRLIEVSNSLKDTRKLNQDQFDIIAWTNAGARAVESDKNDTRRFFETRLGQYMLGQGEKLHEIGSIDRISRAIIEAPTESNRDIANIIPLVAHETHETDKRIEVLQKGTMYEMKDRARRITVFKLTNSNNVEISFKDKKTVEQFVPKMKLDPPLKEGDLRKAKEKLKMELKKEDYLLLQSQGDFSEVFPPYNTLTTKTEPVLSKNIGSLRASSPSFPDEITQKELTNRIVDIYRPGGGTGTYSESRPYSPFVASISGTTFTAIAHMEDYMKTHANSPTLNEDMNNFFKYFIGTYAVLGYHSYHEIQDVLREKPIVDLFKAYHVNLKVNINPYVVDMAMNDTLAYARTLSLKEGLHAAIRAFPPLKQTTPPSSKSPSPILTPPSPPMLASSSPKTVPSLSVPKAIKGANHDFNIILKNGKVIISFKEILDKNRFLANMRTIKAFETFPNADIKAADDKMTASATTTAAMAKTGDKTAADKTLNENGKANGKIELSKDQYIALQKEKGFSELLPKFDNLSSSPSSRRFTTK